MQLHLFFQGKPPPFDEFVSPGERRAAKGPARGPPKGFPCTPQKEGHAPSYKTLPLIFPDFFKNVFASSCSRPVMAGDGTAETPSPLAAF